MIPAPFDYAAPESLEEAVALLESHGDDAKILTGGHSLIPLLKLRLARPSLVVDLRRVRTLSRIHREGDLLQIGAAATHAEVMRSDIVHEACPLLTETAATIGDVQVRNLGTIGGSVVHADPASDWPAALLACDAEMVLAGPGGDRVIGAGDFFVGALESAASPAEILAQLRVKVPAAGTAGCYEKIAQSASGFALAGCAVQLRVDGDKIVEARVAVTGVAETPYRPTTTEQALVDEDPTADTVATAAEHATDGVTPLEDIHASAPFRLQLARVVTQRALTRALARVGEAGA